MPFFVERAVDQYGNRSFTAAVIEAEIVEDPLSGKTLKVSAPEDFKWKDLPYSPRQWAECKGPARFLSDWSECDKVIADAVANIK